MVDEQQLSFTEYAAKLQRHTSNADVIAWWDINPRDWISESAQIRETVYPKPPSDPKKAARAVLFLRLPIHTGDGAAIEPGRRAAGRVSQRHLRRTATAAGRASPLMFRKFAVAALLALSACATRPVAVAPPVPAAPVEVQSSPSTISTAISNRRRRSRSPGGQQQAQDPDRRRRHLAAALAGMRRHHNTVTVSAGEPSARRL